MEVTNLNEELMNAIVRHDVEAVKNCLENGAYPNYSRFRDDEEPNGLIQPTTPLRMVMFCISDCMLEDDDLKYFTEIAKLLIHYGADPKPAMEIAEDRYGKYDPDAQNGLFMEVWRIVSGDG